VLSRLFRRLFLEALKTAFDQDQLKFFGDLQSLSIRQNFLDYLAPLSQCEWVVYAKPPFGGPQQVLEYLGRYTHRVAISNQRLLNIDNDQVTFRYKDYRLNSTEQNKVMSLSADEFIRRFLLHVLPSGLRKIRFYGFLSNRQRKTELQLGRLLLTAPASELLPQPADCRDLYEALTGRSLKRCPVCGTGEMIRVSSIAPVRRARRRPDT
jgi:Putative transposase